MVCASTFMSAGYSVFFIFLISCWLTRALPFSSFWDGLPSAADMWRNSHAEIAYLATVDFIFYLACLHAPVEFHLVKEGFRHPNTPINGAPSIDLWFLFRISSAYRRLLIITTPWWELGSCSWDFSTSLSCCFEFPVRGGSLLLYLVVLKNSLPAWDLFLISASLGGETYCVSLSAISISRCRAGEWPDDNIMYILGRSHLFPGLHIWPIFCQWNRITFIVIRSILEQQSIVECLFLFIFNIGNILPVPIHLQHREHSPFQCGITDRVFS